MIIPALACAKSLLCAFKSLTLLCGTERRCCWVNYSRQFDFWLELNFASCANFSRALRSNYQLQIYQVAPLTQLQLLNWAWCVCTRDANCGLNGRQFENRCWRWKLGKSCTSWNVNRMMIWWSTFQNNKETLSNIFQFYKNHNFSFI